MLENAQGVYYEEVYIFIHADSAIGYAGTQRLWGRR